MTNAGLQPCGHPMGAIGGDDQEGTHYCLLCAPDAGPLLPEVGRVYNAGMNAPDIDIKRHAPAVEYRRGGVYVYRGALPNSGVSYNDDVLLGSDLQALEDAKRLVSEGFIMQLDSMIEDAFVTGKPPVMSIASDNST